VLPSLPLLGCRTVSAPGLVLRQPRGVRGGGRPLSPLGGAGRWCRARLADAIIIENDSLIRTLTREDLELLLS
jgi:hypothetical protein